MRERMLLAILCTGCLGEDPGDGPPGSADAASIPAVPDAAPPTTPPPAGTILATGPRHPFDVVVDETHVYWVTCEQFADLSTILRVPKSGGPYETLATYPLRIYNIAIDDGHVYAPIWGDDGIEGTGELGRVPLAGGAMEILIDDISWPYLAAVDAAHVYFSPYVGGPYDLDYAIWRYGKADASVERLVEGGVVRGPLSMAIDSKHLYMTDSDGRFFRMSLDNAAVEEPFPELEAGTVAIDRDTVYFQGGYIATCPALTIQAWPTLGGPLRDLGGTADCASDLAAAAGTVFVARDAAGQITAFPGDGSGPVVLATTDRPVAVAAEPDATSIYWVEFETGNVVRLDR